MIESEYKCQKCNFYWFGYRIIWHRCGMSCPSDCKMDGKKYPKMTGPGMTECPKCGHIYVDWINWTEVLKSLGNYWERK